MPPVRRQVVAALTVLAVVPGVATAQSIDPSTAVDVPGPLRAAGSFVLVLLFGGAVLYRYGEFVNHTVDVSMEHPGISLVYGTMAYGLVLFMGGYALNQLGQLGIGSTGLLAVLLGVVSPAVLGLSGLGYAVVGARLTELEGDRRLWPGLVVGAAVSALPWLFLTPLAGLVVWVAVAAVGIGGSTREWMHVSRSVDTEADT